MADEANHKVEMMLKTLDKLNDAVQKLQIEVSVIAQKFKDHADVVFDKVDSIVETMGHVQKKVEDMREKELKREGFMQGLKMVLLKHPVMLSTIVGGAVFLSQSDYFRDHFLK